MQKKRILVFNDCFYMGGTEILLVNLLNHLVDKECDVILLLPNPSDRNVLLDRVSPKVPVQYIFPKQQKGLKRWIFKNILIFYPRMFAWLTGFDSKKFDQIVCFKDGFYSILFSKLNMPKYLWIQNQPYQRDYKGHNLKENLAYILNKRQIRRMTDSFDKFDRVICVSDSCKKSYINIYHKGEAKRDIEVLYNALDLSGIGKRAEEAINLPKPDYLCFIIVIRLSYEKTVERAIVAAERLRKENYKFEIRILGDGAEFDKLKDLIKEYRLDDIITMYGRIPNPFPYMKRADWLLCPSSRESFALTLIEAISLGTPVITTDCGGPEDVVARGEYGVFTENSEDGVYLGMKKVLDDPTLLPYFKSKTEENMSRFEYKRWLREVEEVLGV